MKLNNKIAALEKASTASTKLCRIVYKAKQGPESEVLLTLEKALQEARTGHVKEIHFPLTFNEEQAERMHTRNQLEHMLEECRSGIKRDSESPTCSNLILCTKPVVFARQAPPRGGVGGNFITEDGTPFHQTEWREILNKYDAGFIVVRDYDETREPWYSADNEQ